MPHIYVCYSYWKQVGTESKASAENAAYFQQWGFVIPKRQDTQLVTVAQSCLIRGYGAGKPMLILR